MEELEEKEANEAFVEDQLQASINVAFKATRTYLPTETQQLQRGESSNSYQDKLFASPAEFVEDAAKESTTPSFKLGILTHETLIETENVHSKRQFIEGEEQSTAQKIQRTGDDNGREFRKRGRKSRSFRLIHGSPEVVNFETNPHSALKLVDPISFVEPPPGFKNFKKHTRPTRRIHLAKVQGRVSAGSLRRTKNNLRQIRKIRKWHSAMARKEKLLSSSSLVEGRATNLRNFWFHKTSKETPN